MGRKKIDQKSHTLPPSPTYSFSSSSSSDFEFTISCSPRKSSTPLCRPADELFYKGQLLPLHLSPRLSMVRTLLLLPSSSSSSSYAASDTTASRDSTVSSSNDSRDSCDSSARPSSVAEEDEFKRLNSRYSSNDVIVKQVLHNLSSQSQISKKNNKYFSLSRFSSVFKKDPTKQQRVVVDADQNDVFPGSNSVKRVSNTAKEVIRKYMKMVKPLYEKLSQKQQKMTTATSVEIRSEKLPSSTDHEISGKASARNRESTNGGFSHSFSGNLKYPRKRGCVASCPSSMRCSPSHSGVLTRTGQPATGASKAGATTSYATVDRSSMEELQSAIQGAIAHCKNSLVQNKTMFSNEI
ncbi:probable membrane-associated kinase regulator 1 [Argentina anserina]|uniref:probable membrane-associated kinase regulator 1 n=1 Tax=Argentina anserina TaxID=57926 RepID=UPI0021762B2D|nr:probable membrane-associated kinase regulator 1 [Potentilla anserina]